MKKLVDKIWNDLCEEFGPESMLIYTNGWGKGAIADYVKDGIIHGFVMSLYKS
jgi:hypothetical protein